MKTYGLYIKSHNEYPDYEDEVEAESKEEAAKLFAKKLPDWGAEDLLPHISED